jgi:hypothetical protein
MFKVESFKANYSSLTLKEKAFIGLIVLDLMLLLFVGRDYTRNSFYSYLYYHDVILFVTFIFSLTFKSGFRLKSIELLGLISLVYLAVSIVLKLHPEGDMYVYIRQFMVFGYLIQSYFIFKALAGFKNGFQILLQLIYAIAILAAILQLVYIFNILFVIGESPFLWRNYFSPLTVLAVITASAMCLTFLKGYKKIVIFLFLLAISFSFGHDSAYLALILVFLFSYFINAPLKLKVLISFAVVIGCIALWIFIESFSDVNADSRLFFWNEVLSNAIKNYSIIYGNGFGGPYISPEAAEKLNDIVLVFRDPESIYVVSPHNSFITLLFHLGLWVLLLFYPLKSIFLGKWEHKNKSLKFLLLSLVGVAIWASFNVILELPHSSTYFWLIYFTLAFYLHKNSVDDKKNALQRKSQ